MWSSGWVRTLFFNPTQPDEQDLKPSPRVRAPKVVQGSGLDRVWPPKPTRRTELSVQFNPSDKILGPTLGLTAQPEIFVWAEIRVECSTNKYVCSIQFVERNAAFDSTRRTKTRIRPTLPNKTGEPGSTRQTGNLCSTLLNPRVERPSSGSTQPDGHSKQNDEDDYFN